MLRRSVLPFIWFPRLSSAPNRASGSSPIFDTPPPIPTVDVSLQVPRFFFLKALQMRRPSKGASRSFTLHVTVPGCSPILVVLIDYCPFPCLFHRRRLHELSSTQFFSFPHASPLSVSKFYPFFVSLIHRRQPQFPRSIAIWFFALRLILLFRWFAYVPEASPWASAPSLFHVSPASSTLLPRAYFNTKSRFVYRMS